MSGAITIDNQHAILGATATVTAVYRFNPEAEEEDEDGEDKRYTLVPNIAFEQVTRRVGPHASVARFHYVLDNSGHYPDWPSDFGQIWPQDAVTSPYVLSVDDRIVVIAWSQEGDATILFDGYAQIPQVDLAGDQQIVSFTATGVECRAWDLPVTGRIQRDASDPEDGDHRQTDLPVRFNPSDGRGGVLPNCTPDDHDIDEDDEAKSYPCFIDEHLSRDPDPRTKWTIRKAIRYILATQNDGEYVENPDFAKLDELLIIKVPKDDDGTFDPEDPETYDVKEVPLRDYDATNKPWPTVLQDLLSMVGFGFYFTAYEQPTEDGPSTRINVFRIDQSQRIPLDVLLDEYGEQIDPSRNDVISLSLARDVNQVVNAYTVETMLRRWEVSVVLAPGFKPQAGDEVRTVRSKFLRSRLDSATTETMRKYRWYIADECGDGHWEGGEWKEGQPIDLSELWPDDEKTGKKSYVDRYRKGTRQLLSKDSSGQPCPAVLVYSQDYTGDAPGLWDGTGSWHVIPEGWKLLEHQLGIEITSEDPELIFLGAGKTGLKGITWQANPPAGKRFVLMLTTVVDDDVALPSVVPMRVASPTKFERRQRIDAKDHYRLDTITALSWHNNGEDVDDIVARDDTEDALDLARQYRAANEMPLLAGTITIPYLSAYYELGDQIGAIDGRNISLHTSAAGDKGEAKRSPFIASITHACSNDSQTTTLQLTDLRAEPRARNL